MLQRLCIAGAILLSLQLQLADAFWAFGPVKPYDPKYTERTPGAAPTTLTAAQGAQLVAQGFPLWYREDSGKLCEPCTHYSPGGTGDCLSTYDGLDPDNPDAGSDPSILPDELFYYSVTASVEDPAIPGFRIRYENGVEGAYAVGPRIPGDEIVFQRTRFVVDCPDAKPNGTKYWFKITTPYMPEPHTLEAPAAGGKRCVVETIDIGVAPGNFGDSLKGPIDSLLKPQKTPPAGQAGNFGTGVEEPHTKGGADAAITVESNAFPAAIPKLVYSRFQTSCKAYQGSAAVVTSAFISQAADNKATVEVYLTADVGETITITAKGCSGILNPKANDAGGEAVDTVLPATVKAANPTFRLPNYYGKGEFTLNDAAGTISELTLVVTAKTASGASSTFEYTAKPIFTTGSSVTFDGSNLQINLDSTAANAQWQMVVFDTAGRLSSTVATNAPATARRMLRATTSTFTGSAKGYTVPAAAPPREIWACWYKADGKYARSDCVSFPVTYSLTSNFTNAPQITVAASVARSQAVVGETVNLIGTGSTPPYGSGCTATWAATTDTGAAAPQVNITQPTTGYDASFTVSAPGSYQFTMTLDCGGTTSVSTSTPIPFTCQDVTAGVAYAVTIPDTLSKSGAVLPKSVVYKNVPFYVKPVVKSPDGTEVAATDVTWTVTNDPVVCQVEGGSLKPDATNNELYACTAASAGAIKATAEVGTTTKEGNITFTVSDDTFSNQRMDILSSTSDPWSVRFEFDSIAALANGGQDVYMTVYYLGDDSSCNSLECAQKKWKFSQATRVPCTSLLTPNCFYKGPASLKPASSATTGTAPAPSRRSRTWYVYIVTEGPVAGNVISGQRVQANIKG